MGILYKDRSQFGARAGKFLVVVWRAHQLRAELASGAHAHGQAAFG